MLKEKLLQDLKEAMRDKQELKKDTVQLIRAAILQAEKDQQIELDDNQILQIIAKESKKRKDSLPDYEKSGRQDLIKKILEEIEVIAQYLPKQLSSEEIEIILKEIVSQTNATSMKDMGTVMKFAKEKMGATADGRVINEIVKKLLN